MLSQCDSLVRNTECRYASDAELIFLLHYRKSYVKRFSLYKKIEQLELSITKAVYEKIQTISPQILRSGQKDISGKWKQDTLRTIRYCAVAVLLDDSNSLREKYLLWFQTLMGAFNVRQSCEITYTVMQQVIAEMFAPEEAEMLNEMVELVRATLGSIP